MQIFCAYKYIRMTNQVTSTKATCINRGYKRVFTGCK